LQKIRFAEALDSIVAADNRYSREPDVFLRDALDYTTKQQKKTKGAAGCHLSLCLGSSTHSKKVLAHSIFKAGVEASKTAALR